MHRRTVRGMSLVEVLVAFGVLTLAATVSLQVLSSTRRGHSRSEARNSAAFVARSLLDQARSAPFDTLAGSSGVVTVPGIRDGQAFQRTYNQTTSVVDQGNDLKRVWVSVSWSETGGPSTVVLETLVFKN